MRRSQQ
jgi:hypothetical protein